MLLHNTGRPPLRCVQVLLEGLPNLSKLPGTRSAQSQAFVACPQHKRGQQNTQGSWESRTWVTWGTFLKKSATTKKNRKQHGKPQISTLVRLPACTASWANNTAACKAAREDSDLALPAKAKLRFLEKRRFCMRGRFSFGDDFPRFFTGSFLLLMGLPNSYWANLGQLKRKKTHEPNALPRKIGTAQGSLKIRQRMAIHGNSAGDLFGMVKTWPELKGCSWPPMMGINRSRIESPGEWNFKRRIITLTSPSMWYFFLLNDTFWGWCLITVNSPNAICIQSLGRPQQRFTPTRISSEVGIGERIWKRISITRISVSFPLNWFSQAVFAAACLINHFSNILISYHHPSQKTPSKSLSQCLSTKSFNNLVSTKESSQFSGFLHVPTQDSSSDTKDLQSCERQWMPWPHDTL